MKLVSGRSLDAVIRATAAGLAGRLALLPHVIAVAEAIAYAHSQRVIHRDLKPANVLVGALRRDGGHRLGPREGPGGAGDGRADEPAPAVRRRGRRRPDRRRARCSARRPTCRPSRRAASRSTSAPTSTRSARCSTTCSPARRRTPGTTVGGGARRGGLGSRREPLEPRASRTRPRDLVAIVDKAMAREPPGDRYPTARELAEDLRRFQTGQLVERPPLLDAGARPPLGRGSHRAAVTVAAVLGLALVAAVAVGFLAVRRQARIAEAERDRARLGRGRGGAGERRSDGDAGLRRPAHVGQGGDGRLRPRPRGRTAWRSSSGASPRSRPRCS